MKLTVLFCEAASNRLLPWFVASFNHHFINCTQMSAISTFLYVALAFHQNRRAGAIFLHPGWHPRVEAQAYWDGGNI